MIFWNCDWTALSLDILSLRVSGRASGVSPPIPLTSFNNPSLTNLSTLSPLHSGWLEPENYVHQQIKYTPAISKMIKRNKRQLLIKPVAEDPIFDTIEIDPPVRSVVGSSTWEDSMLLSRAVRESMCSSHSCSAIGCTEESHCLAIVSEDKASVGGPYRLEKNLQPETHLNLL